MHHCIYESNWNSFALHNGYCPRTILTAPNGIFLALDLITHEWIISRVVYRPNHLFIADQSYSTQFFSCASIASHQLALICTRNLT